MAIELTEQQQHAIDDDTPPRLTDPRTRQEYVLVPAAEYEAIREVLEDDRRQAAIHRIGRRTAAKRMEADP